MMTGISAAIKAIFDSLSCFFSFAETKEEHQSESEVIKDRKKLQIASDVAEDIELYSMKK